MKRIILISGLLIALISSSALADSMAQFRTLIESAKAPATDYGAMVGPEIYSVNNYPQFPKAGESVIVRAKVGSYDSVVSYRIQKVEIKYWKPGEEAKTEEMKLEDKEHDIYSFELPALDAGEQLLYTISALDDWGNQAIEINPGSGWRVITDDSEDSELHKSVDIKRIFASYEKEELNMCIEMNGKPMNMIGQEIPAYGIFMFGKGFRYKNDYTETELTSGWLAGYVPFLGIKDLVSVNELFAIFNKSGEQVKRAKFSKKGSRLCYTFDPYIVKKDIYNGIKIIGVTLLVVTNPEFAAKPADTTKVTMLYPVVHSYKVLEIN